MGYIKNFKIVETNKLGLSGKNFASQLETSINGLEVRKTKNNGLGYKTLKGVIERGVGEVKQLISTSNTSHQFVHLHYSTVAEVCNYCFLIL